MPKYIVVMYRRDSYRVTASSYKKALDKYVETRPREFDQVTDGHAVYRSKNGWPVGEPLEKGGSA